MVAYEKPWLSIEEQVAKLASRGVEVHPEEHTADVLRAVGYYRLTGTCTPSDDPNGTTRHAGRAFACWATTGPERGSAMPKS
jgi:abortive infection bacteriophage resistance protein